MTKILTSLFLGLLIFSDSSAQAYLPIIEEDKIWSTLTRKIRILNPGEEDFVIDILTEQYSIGESILLEDGNEWRALYVTTDSLFSWDSPNLELKGYLREIDQQVFFSRTSFNIPDEPIFNFNLELGDTALVIIDTGEKSALIVNQIDDITLDDNILRKRILLDNVDLTNESVLSQVTWVEGLGDLLRGLLPDYNPTLRSLDSLQCVNINGNLVYQSPDFVDCFFEFIVDSKEVPEPISFNLFPNPCQDYAKFVFPKELKEVKNIVVFNNNGKIIFASSNLLILGELYLETNDWPPGTYFINIYFRNTSKYGVAKLVRLPRP